jgi:hypothetical protein
MFEKSQMKHNSLNCHNFLEYFSVIAYLHAQSLTQIKKKKLHVQNTQTLKMDNPCFFQTSFSLPNVHIIPSKIKNYFNIDD